MFEMQNARADCYAGGSASTPVRKIGALSLEGFTAHEILRLVAARNRYQRGEARVERRTLMLLVRGTLTLRR